ncbi:hypothetical protein [Myroides fluvii]|nr:hypothetical protein [Myroides fluvii]
MMKIMQASFSRRAIIRFACKLFLVGMLLGAYVAYKQNEVKNKTSYCA